MGDPLRRGRPADDRAERLRQPALARLAAGRTVLLVQAGVDLLADDPVDACGRHRRGGRPVRPDGGVIHRRVGVAGAVRADVVAGAVRRLPGGGPLREPARGGPGGRGAGHLSAVLAGGPSGDDRHAVRRAHDPGAGAGFSGPVRRQRRRVAAPGAGPAVVAPPSAVLSDDRAVHRVRPAPADDRRRHGPLGAGGAARSRAGHPRLGADAALFRRFRRLHLLGLAHPEAGAILPLHRRHPVRAGRPGQGAGGPGPAGDRVRRLPAVHLELEAAGARPAGLRRAGGAARLRGGGHSLAPRHAGPPRAAVLGRAIRRQPLAPPGARAPRRPGRLRLLPARAGLRGPALDRPGARRAGLGGGKALPGVGRCAPSGRRAPP